MIECIIFEKFIRLVFPFLCKFAAMKKITLTTILLYLFVLSSQAQEPRFIFDNDSVPLPPKKELTQEQVKLDSLNKVLPAMPSWRIDPRFGERIPVSMDTTTYGINQRSIVDGQDVAVGYLGNLGSPAMTKIFFDREDISPFNYLNAFNYYFRRPGNQVFLNTKQPYSNVWYQSGGSRQSKEERFKGLMSMNFNKKLSVGFDIDYIYSRGYYQYLSNKQMNSNFYASYVSDRYQMHAFIATNSYNNSENGGITYPGYLKGKNPLSTDGTIDKNSSLTFPTNLSSTWNKLYGSQFYVTNKYSVGYEREDTTEFVPVASFIMTNYYTHQRRKFYSNDTSELNDFYNIETTSSSDYGVDERMGFASFKNIFAIQLNEGFREWVKFGLTAFIQQDFRKYELPDKSYPSIFESISSENSTVIGGVLSKEKGRFLKYNLSADLGVLGYNVGESNLKADITTAINIKGQDAYVKGIAYIKNTKPTYLQNHYVSRYANWDNDFSDIRRVYIGGEINIPHTKTRISGGVENIKNYIYYSLKDIAQDGGNTQIVSLRLDQDFKAGILHWNNQLVFQTSSNDDVIPLPKFSAYSNLYILVRLAKVLKIQLGVDAHFNTKYYAPGYSPALIQFYNQKVYKVGNFPMTTAYANLHWKNTRFFLMMYNVAQGLGETNYMTLPLYPVNPMIFKFGLSWDFFN